MMDCNQNAEEAKVPQEIELPTSSIAWMGSRIFSRLV